MSSDNNPIRTANFIVRLFRGDVSLAATYWLFGVLGSAPFHIAFKLYEYNYAEITVTGASKLLTAIWLLSIISISYGTFILIAIWRSAGKYKGRGIWSTLARFVVVMNTLALIASIVNPILQSPTATLQDEMELMNKSLPITIDENTRLDRASLQDGNIYFYATLINISADTSSANDIENFHAAMTTQLRTAMCPDPIIQQAFEEGRDIVYVYRDKDDNSFAQITISESDCSVQNPSIATPTPQSSTAALQNEIELANKSLPTTLDEFTRLDRISLQGEDVYYSYTLIDVSVNDFSANGIENFHTTQSDHLQTFACDTPATRQYLEDGRNVVYVYKDAIGDLVTQITVKKTDCSVTTPPTNQN